MKHSLGLVSDSPPKVTAKLIRRPQTGPESSRALKPFSKSAALKARPFHLLDRRR